jgi:NADPH2:quinone reductase
MKEAIVHAGEKVEIINVPIPTPEADQVVIKVVVSGSNPKDWYYNPQSSSPHPFHKLMREYTGKSPD